MLQDLLRSERRSNKLMSVSTRFWRDVRAFLDEVTARFREEQEKDPFSRRVMLLTDEVKNARQAVESLWALRERKMALFALAQVKEGAKKRPDHLTPREQRVYDDVLETLRRGREAVLEGHAMPEPVGASMKEAPEKGPAPAAPASPPEATPSPAAAVSSAAGEGEAAPDEGEQEAAVQAAGKPPAQVPPDTPDDDMVTIRAVADIPQFVGPDMQTYLLKEGDVATVPKAIAGLLERRKKAAVIEA
jgi:DNA replication initiation complex subunit (GINS family)